MSIDNLQHLLRDKSPSQPVFHQANIMSSFIDVPMLIGLALHIGPSY